MDNQSLDYKTIGNKIKATRQQKEITREKLSEMVGISAMYLGQLERGERRGGINNYIAIANALELSLDFMFFNVLNTIDVIDNQIMHKINNALHKME
jgi:transcriptional regulator with XRE-family HTH domain